MKVNPFQKRHLFTSKRFWTFLIIVLIALMLCLDHQATTTWAATPAAASSDANTIETPVEAPFWVDAEAGAIWNIFGLKIVGKVMSQQTNGKYAVVVSTAPPSGGPPLHVHQHEDEMFYVLKGTYEFQFGNETVIANAGDWVHLPRQIPHRFRNIGTEPGETMNLLIPGGLEQFFVEIDRFPKNQPLDRRQLAEIASRYGLRFFPAEN